MAISLVAVGQKWTATIANAIIAALNIQGTSIVTPTSVAGTGTSLSGSKVVAATASTISVNGCFTSTYDSYLVEADLTHSTSSSNTLRLRLSGTDDTAAVYDLQTLSGTGATASAAQVLAATSWGMTGINSIRENHSITFNSPALAVATEGLLGGRATANPMTSANGLGFRMLQHRSLTAYDGFTITPAAGTLTGTVRIYGWNNG
jgi:hypothetical protein